MPETVVPRVLSRPLLVVSGAAAAMLGVAIALWAYYGPAVFFETIRAGFVACFG